MNKRTMQKWVKALRSGKYKQGSGTLCKRFRDEFGNITKIEYCCLGVLNEVCNLGTAPNYSYLSEGSCRKVNISVYDDKVTEPVRLTKPKVVFKDENLNKNYPYRSAQSFLAVANDSGEWSFNRIANWIEKNYNKF